MTHLVGDSPRGPLKQRGNPHLKPATKPKHSLPNHAGYGPCCRDPDGPPRRPSRRSPRAGSASLEDARPPRVGSAPFEGVRFPRAGSASLKGPLPLEQAPPRSRVHPALDQGPPRSRAPLTRAPAPYAGIYALTPAGRRHHASGARAPVLPHQLPRRKPIPITVGRDCTAGPVPVP
jgi:hypothetical protein